MKTIVVDIHDRANLQKQIADLRPKQGDTLRFVPSNGEDIAVTVLLAVVSHMIETQDKSSDFAAQVLHDLFQNKSLEELEREVEDEYGVNIEIKESIKQYPNPDYKSEEVDEVLRTFQERALKSWGGKIDGDTFLKEIRGKE